MKTVEGFTIKDYGLVKTVNFEDVELVNDNFNWFSLYCKRVYSLGCNRKSTPNAINVSLMKVLIVGYGAHTKKNNSSFSQN